MDIARESLGARMKADYEDRTRYYLPRRTHTLVRVDGRAFHTYTRGCDRPFDLALMAAMDAAAIALCQEMSGAALAYVQSDEISVLLTDFSQPQTQAWFDGNVQKIASISASIATAAFLAARPPGRLAHFDARVWTIPLRGEVANYFLWRQLDARRNALSMTARAHFSQRQVDGKGVGTLRAMLAERGVDPDATPAGFRFGRLVTTRHVERDIAFVHKKTGVEQTLTVTRGEWEASPAPDWKEDRASLLAKIPG